MCRMRFDFSLSTHDYTSPTGFVCITYTADTVYIASGREIGSLDVLHQAVNIDFVIVNVSYTGIYYF